MIKKILYLTFFLLSGYSLFAGQENVPVTNSVYSFLTHAEVRGLIPHSSLTYLPLQRNEVVSYLKKIRENAAELSVSEMKILNEYEIEFEIQKRENTVIFFSETDSNEIFFNGLFSDKEKFIYHYKDSLHTVNFLPLANIEGIYERKNEESRNVILGNLGFRLHGTLSNLVGYNLQVTNGVIVSGDRQVALEQNKLKQNVKFAILNSDFDFTESHVRFQYDWFYAIIGRETRLVGSGLAQSLFLSDNAPAMDGFSLGARFSSFEYRFDHFNMIAYPDSNGMNAGFLTSIIPKYMSMHKFSFKPFWGEISYIQSIVYSGRPAELAYLTPLSFTKSLEHSLHDRDKSMMGVMTTLRPLKNIQIKGSWMLEDIIISRIGTGYWSNKTAWNIGLMTSLPGSVDAGMEYSRIEPYMFTHFNYQNNRTNDGILIGTYLLPNSDETALHFRWFWGSRFPLELKLAYQRHGENLYDNTGKLIKNVGSNPYYCIQLPRDSETVTFLDGNRTDAFLMELKGGFEIVRGFNIKGMYSIKSMPDNVSHSFYLSFAFDEF